MSLTFNMSANAVLLPVFLSRLSPDSNFRESDCMLQRSFGLLDACFFFFFMQSINFFYVYLLNYHNELLSYYQ